MDAAVGPIVEQFRVSTNLFVKALGGMDRDALLTRPGARSNPPVWIAGHLTQTRARIVTILGGPTDVPWTGLFETGSVVRDLAAFPDADAILATWKKLSEQLMQRFGSLTHEQLGAAPPPRVASPDGTLRGALALFAFHEGYHIGQLGFLRKWLGVGSLLD
jgi:hypothetical protein